MMNFVARCKARSRPSEKQCTKEHGHEGMHYSADMCVAWEREIIPYTRAVDRISITVRPAIEDES